MLNRIRLANAPCSFGVMAGFEPSPPLTYTDVLDQIADAGFAGTELGDWGFMPDEPPALAYELKLRDLALVGAFTPVELTHPDNTEIAIADALRAARLLAACASPETGPGPYVIIAAASARHPHRRHLAGRIRDVDGLTADEWSTLSHTVNKIARAVMDETGVATVFHPHCATPVETLAETIRFAETTDPQLVGLCFDTGHVAYAGDDLFAWLSLFASRTRLVHFKEMDPNACHAARKGGWDYRTAVSSGLFCPLGDGCLDFAIAHRALVDAGYSGWIVVEDELPPGRVPPLEAAKRDRAFLAGLGL